MVVCVAVGCSNKPDRKIPGVTYHRFPLDRLRRQQWVLAVKRANWLPGKNSLLCSRHFEKEMFDRRGKGKLTLLKSTAVPTIFDKKIFSVKQECLPPETDTISQWPLPVKQEPLEEILNDSQITALLNEEQNQLLVVPDTINIDGTVQNHCENTKNNVVVVSNCPYTQNILNSEGINDNRMLIVSDGTDVITERAAYNEENRSSTPWNSKTNNFDLQKFNHDPLILHSDEFIRGRVKELEVVVEDYKKKLKVLGQTSRRQNARIDLARKELCKVTRKLKSKKSCTCSPVVHLLEHGL